MKWSIATHKLLTGTGSTDMLETCGESPSKWHKFLNDKGRVFLTPLLFGLWSHMQRGCYRQLQLGCSSPCQTRDLSVKATIKCYLMSSLLPQWLPLFSIVDYSLATFKIFQNKQTKKNRCFCKSVSRGRLSIQSGHFIFTTKELSQDIILSYKAL